MQAIEKEFVIPDDGRLPETFCQAFGHKARVIVLLPEESAAENISESDSERLMRFAGTIDWPIDDVMEWQHQQHSEWDREWDR